MTIEEADKYIREHAQDLENLAADGHPLGRAIAVLYELYRNEPSNMNAGRVLTLAVEEYRDKLIKQGRSRSIRLRRLN